VAEISIILGSLGNVYLSSQTFFGIALLNGCHILRRGHQEDKLLLLSIRKYSKSFGIMELSLRGALCYVIPSGLRGNVEMKISGENLEGCFLSCTSWQCTLLHLSATAAFSHGTGFQK